MPTKLYSAKGDKTDLSSLDSFAKKGTWPKKWSEAERKNRW